MEDGIFFVEKKRAVFGADNFVRKKQEQMQFKTLAENWLNNVKLHIKESSYVKYHNIVKNHIIPGLGEIVISDFTTNVVEMFIEEKLTNGKKTGKGGLSEKTVKDILVVIKEICSLASSQNVILPCRLELIKIRSRQPEIHILERNEQMKLETLLLHDEDFIKTGVLMSLYMGLRLGEVCALKRKHILFHSGILQVRGTMQRIQNFEKERVNKTKIIITEPKTSSSVRDIPIPDFLMKRLKMIENISAQAYILTGTPERYIEPRTLENIFKSYLRQCEIGTINYHALRHTFATRCIESGFDVKSLSEILGHSNVNITLNRYVHSSMDQKRKNMERLKPQAEIVN